jgi:predicted dienelactone hydrolase
MRSGPLFLIWAALGGSACAQTESKSDDGGSPSAGLEGGYDVGFTVLTAAAPDALGRQRVIDIAVWYPSRDEPRDTTYDYSQNQVATRLAREGKPIKGRFPLVLYSHGATGCGLSMAFLAERLASQGYIVAGPDYTDEFYAARIRGRGRLGRLEQVRMVRWLNALRKTQLNTGGKAYRHEKLAYRPAQASVALDRVLKEGLREGSLLEGVIDETAIGLVGHSFGAWTSLLLAGADPEFADHRVKAVVALSGPCNEAVYEPDELGKIQVPTLFMFGSDEPGAGRMDDEVLLYDRATAPKLLIEVQGAEHFTFSGGIRSEFASMGGYLRLDSRRQIIVNYTVAFLESTLKGDPAATAFLEKKAPGVSKHVSDMTP